MSETRGLRKGLNPVQLTVELMRKGHRCSEAVVMAFAAQAGIDADTAARISGGFGGYQAPGWTCGAVTGATMVIGLLYGAGVGRNGYSTDLCNQMTQEFSHRFKARRTSIGCEELHLAIKRNPLVREDVKTKKGRQRFCSAIAVDAVETLEELLAEEPNRPRK